MTTRDTLFITDGDRAAEFGTVTAIQRSDLFGLRPTGADQVPHHWVFTLRRGLITYEQRIYDFGGVLDRLEKAVSTAS